MKRSILVFAIGFALGSRVLAQDASAGAAASTHSASAVSADSRGVSASQANNATVAAASAPAAANAAEGTEMSAALSKPINARRARPGDEVSATLTHDTTANGATRLPRGTMLVGHVTEAKPHTRPSASADGSSRLGIAFDKAVLADGREVPVAATIQAIAESKAVEAGTQRSADAWQGGGLAPPPATAARGGAGLVGRVAGTTTALGSAAYGRTLSSSVGSIANVSAVTGGVGASGELLAGARGVFGMRNVSLVHDAAGGARESVLTSATGNVQLGRGTQMLLVTQAAGEAR